jgi:bifunctional DNA-binding transcriptional regulator/antitoxin component of YhaV-PrlF toxin-antitoxin module
MRISMDGAGRIVIPKRLRDVREVLEQTRNRR